MVNEFIPNDSSSLQEESLVLYMEALGYDPIYKWDGYNGELLVGFRSDKYVKDGVGRVSVNTAVDMHNYDPEFSYDMIREVTTDSEKYKNFIKNRSNYLVIASLFAGTCKIVESVKACGSKTRGLVVHDHNVKFMSEKYKRSYGPWIGIHLKG